MTMRKILTVIVALSALTLAACNEQQVADDMATAKRVLAAIQNGVAVTASAVRQGLDAACANQGTVGVGYQTARSLLIQQTGPSTTRNIDNLDRAMASYTTVCAEAANPNASNLSSLLSRALAAYAAYQAAKAKAGV